MKLVMLDALTLGEFEKNMFEKFGDFVAYDTTTPEQVIERCSDANIILTNKVVLDSNNLAKLPKLKLICITATGMNNIDLDYAKEQNITVKNVAGYSTHAVAQHTLMLALGILGGFLYYSKYVQSGDWVKSDIFCHLDYEIRDLYGKEWGIIGYGTIGKQVCKLAQAFGANVSFHSTSGRNTTSDIPHKSLEELLSTSDIISIHAPLNDKTQNLITQKELQTLKKHAILINLGRGGIVNENDLAKTLKTQDFFFATDVLEKEPMIPNHPLLDSTIADKVVITPHIAWAYKDTKNRLLQMVAQNIESFLAENTK